MAIGEDESGKLLNRPVTHLDLAEAGFDLSTSKGRWTERDRQKIVSRLVEKASDEKEAAAENKRREYTDARVAETEKGFVNRRGPLIGILAALVAAFATAWGFIQNLPVFHGGIGK